MADLLAISARIIDSGAVDQPVNRITGELSEVADGVAVVESFSHSIVVATGEGLLAFDASGVATGAGVVRALRGWSAEPVNTLVYTHGHLDHVGGSPAWTADAERRGSQRPRFVSHQAVLARLARYRLTGPWNRAINARQFGWLNDRSFGIGSGSGGFLPPDVAEPDTTYAASMDLSVGEVEVSLRHGRGETDDHTWAWLPAKRAIASGDFLIWNFPNAGNPQKVQRYPLEWAQALRDMIAMRPELLLPAHGLPIAGEARITRVLGDVAGALERLVASVLDAMNSGASLDEIVHSVSVDDATLALPYLRPLYDEPEFVVRNIWRLYGGWWDANPARLKPPADSALAAAVAAMAGGAGRLIAAAEEAAGSGDLRLACQLGEWARQSAPDDREVGERVSAIYRQRAASETSLMAKGIFNSAAERATAERAGA